MISHEDAYILDYDTNTMHKIDQYNEDEYDKNDDDSSNSSIRSSSRSSSNSSKK